MPEDNEYICTLDSASIKKAKDELGEIPEDRMAAVQALREWCETQPHISFNTSTEVLLRFLRGAKFSQLRAREMIEGTLTFKNTYPTWLQDVDSKDAVVQKMIKTGFMLPLPARDKEGRRVVLQRIGAQDISDKSIQFKDMVHTWIVLGTYFGLDEMTQVNGNVFIMDMTGVTLKHLTRFDRSDMTKWHKAWQGNFPGRFKAFHYYNCGALVDALVTFMKPLMPKKWMDRIHFHDTLESLYKHVPMEMFPEEYLPDDYKGPNAGTCDSIRDSLIREISDEEFRQRLLDESSTKFRLDESKRPKASDEPATLFRKLNVE